MVDSDLIFSASGASVAIVVWPPEIPIPLGCARTFRSWERHSAPSGKPESPMTKKSREAGSASTRRKRTKAAQRHPRAPRASKAAPAADADAEGAQGPRTRVGTKQAELIALLRRPDGATIAEAMAATGWQSHTVRGAIAGALKKRLGLVVSSEKVEGRGRIYRIGS